MRGTQLPADKSATAPGRRGFAAIRSPRVASRQWSRGGLGDPVAVAYPYLVAVVSDEAFAPWVGQRLGGVPGVLAVTLGGSRAEGTSRPDSDWDFSVYYRGAFDPAGLRELGWAGQVFPVRGWGGGVFNGGAWLTVNGRRVDVHYRDLDEVEYHLAEARAGRFRIERLMFHLVGIPTYLLVAELAVRQLVHGDLPRVEGYPEALRRSAAARWVSDAIATLGYARKAYAATGQVTQAAGATAAALACTAHGVLAARGEWITNEKRLIDRAGLRHADEVLVALRAAPESLIQAIDAAQALIAVAVAPFGLPGT
jgi:predicted nucleotidyltransferase